MQRTLRPNIAFAGLSAAGKTTHAKILAEKMGYEWISAIAIILEILGSGGNVEKAWFNNHEKILKSFEDDRVEIELERRVRELAHSKDGLLLDTWAMAYIYEGPLIRIWIESDETSRIRKCYVSQGQKKALNLHECQQLMKEKDNSARSKFIKRLNFDLFTDMSKYDAILSNTDLIPEPTEECSRVGINTFAPVVHDVVHYLADQALHVTAKVSVRDLRVKHGAMVQKINEKPWSFS